MTDTLKIYKNNIEWLLDDTDETNNNITFCHKCNHKMLSFKFHKIQDKHKRNSGCFNFCYSKSVDKQFLKIFSNNKIQNHILPKEYNNILLCFMCDDINKIAEYICPICKTPKYNKNKYSLKNNNGDE